MTFGVTFLWRSHRQDPARNGCTAAAAKGKQIHHRKWQKPETRDVRAAPMRATCCRVASIFFIAVVCWLCCHYHSAMVAEQISLGVPIEINLFLLPPLMIFNSVGVPPVRECLTFHPISAHRTNPLIGSLTVVGLFPILFWQLLLCMTSAYHRTTSIQVGRHFHPPMLFNPVWSYHIDCFYVRIPSFNRINNVPGGGGWLVSFFRALLNRK